MEGGRESRERATERGKEEGREGESDRGEMTRDLEAHVVPEGSAIFAVAEDTGAELRRTRQYLYFCTSKCVSICTFERVNPSYLGVFEPNSCVMVLLETEKAYI
jgi:hypothetical protein